jgi:hypothetical protein
LIFPTINFHFLCGFKRDYHLAEGPKGMFAVEGCCATRQKTRLFFPIDHQKGEKDNENLCFLVLSDDQGDLNEEI